MNILRFATMIAHGADRCYCVCVGRENPTASRLQALNRAEPPPAVRRQPLNLCCLIMRALILATLAPIMAATAIAVAITTEPTKAPSGAVLAILFSTTVFPVACGIAAHQELS